ncbi:MAG: glutamate-1-semialdehyde 2,1-aminomutase, partial [Candidatus Neomarinimicrobiota bacterium]
MFQKSIQLMKKARKYIPGGVNSPVRAFKSVGGTPPFIKKAAGPFIWDADGKRYIDYVGSWGPMILGHAYPPVIKALNGIISKGTSFGAPTEIEITLAEMIVNRVPSCEMVRLVNSGTEATMSAVRLARGITKRDKIIKFKGCYHGHGDSFLIAAGSGALTMGVPDSPGVTKGTAADTLIAEFNDLDSISSLFKHNPGEIASVIAEPVNGNTGCIPPQNNFLQDLRKICRKNGSLLILDEVMTGFRVAYGGANELYGVDADLLTFGKVIGGGLPIGAYGGKKRYMSQIAPEGPVYQAGTLSGNPVAVTAGIETLKHLTRDSYEELETLGSYYEQGLGDIIKNNEYPLSSKRVGSMFTLFFTDSKIWNTNQVTKCDFDKFKQYFHLMLKRGIYLAPSQYEAGFLSLSHTKKLIDETLQ